MPSLRSIANAKPGNCWQGNSALMRTNACFSPRRRYRGLKRKEVRTRCGTSEFLFDKNSCANLYQKLADSWFSRPGTIDLEGGCLQRSGSVAIAPRTLQGRPPHADRVS